MMQPLDTLIFFLPLASLITEFPNFILYSPADFNMNAIVGESLHCYESNITKHDSVILSIIFLGQ